MDEKLIPLEDVSQKALNKIEALKYEEVCSKRRGTGRIEEMLVDHIAKKVFFFTEARCPGCKGTNPEAENSR